MMGNQNHTFIMTKKVKVINFTLMQREKKNPPRNQIAKKYIIHSSLEIFFIFN